MVQKVHPRGVIWVPSNSPHDVRLNWNSGAKSLSSSKACPWVHVLFYEDLALGNKCNFISLDKLNFFSLWFITLWNQNKLSCIVYRVHRLLKYWKWEFGFCEALIINKIYSLHNSTILFFKIRRYLVKPL